jgi:hypothetical protein
VDDACRRTFNISRGDPITRPATPETYPAMKSLTLSAWNQHVKGSRRLPMRLCLRMMIYEGPKTLDNLCISKFERHGRDHNQSHRNDYYTIYTIYSDPYPYSDLCSICWCCQCCCCKLIRFPNLSNSVNRLTSFRLPNKSALKTLIRKNCIGIFIPRFDLS